MHEVVVEYRPRNINGIIKNDRKIRSLVGDKRWRRASTGFSLLNKTREVSFQYEQEFYARKLYKELRKHLHRVTFYPSAK